MTVLVLWLILIGLAPAGTFESFERATFPPAGWTKTNLLGGSGWYRLPVGVMPMPGWGNGTSSVPPVAGAGSFDAYCSYTTGGDHNDQWLITPQLMGLTATSTVSYWSRFMFTNFPDTIYVRISTNTANPSDFTIVAYTNIFARGSWPNQFPPWSNTVIAIGGLGIPAGTPIYIAFQEYEWDNDHNGAAVQLDVISSDLTPAPIARLDTTGQVFNTIYNSNPPPQNFWIQNIGSGDNVSFTNSLAYSGAGGWASLSLLSGSLGFAMDQAVTVSVSSVGMTVGVYQATCSVIVPGAAQSPYQLPIRLNIARSPQSISLGAIPSQLTTNRMTLSATASSALPVRYAIAGGPGILSDGSNLSFSGTGSVSVLAMQDGDNNWFAANTVTATFDVAKASAGMALANMSQVYNGLGHAATVTTDPAGLYVIVTYDGAESAPTNAGAYTVIGEVHDTMYQGAITGILNVAQAPQTIYFGNMAVQAVTSVVHLSATADSGLPVVFSVAGGPGAISGDADLSFSALGDVLVAADQPGNGNWLPAAKTIRTVEVTYASAEVQLSGLRQTYDGTARSVSCLTSPTGLAVLVTYDGAAMPPVAAGIYAVTGTVQDAFYAGQAASALIVSKADQTIAFPVPAHAIAWTGGVTLAATADSGLPVAFVIQNGPGMLRDESNLCFFTTGVVAVLAQQPGDSNWNPAAAATGLFNAVKASQTIAFPNPGNQCETNVVHLTATASSALPVSFSVVSGPATISDVADLRFTGTGGVTIAAGQAGDSLWLAASNVTATFRSVGIQNLPPAPRGVAASKGTFTNSIRISWQAVSNAAKYDLWRSNRNEADSAAHLTVLPAGVLAFDDTAVAPKLSYYYWVRTEAGGLWSLFSDVAAGFASGVSTDITYAADLAVTDFVFLPVNATNLSHPGTISCRLRNFGPRGLVQSPVQLDFYLAHGQAQPDWIGGVQYNLTLADGQETALILPRGECQALTIPAGIQGVCAPKVTVRHLSSFIDPVPTNDTASAIGLLHVRGGMNSPGRTRNDYDGDGRADIAMYSQFLGTWQGLLSTEQYAVNHMVAGEVKGWQSIPGDYDGDGITDIAAYETGTTDMAGAGRWLIWGSSKPGTPMGMQLGGFGYAPVPVDFSGDGITDPLVFRAADGYWVGFCVIDGRMQACEAWLGGPEFRAVPADFDGDNKADAMLYNENNGEWLGILSADGYGMISGYWGGPGMEAVPADFDGDGRADFALYETATGVWTIYLSNYSTGRVGEGYCIVTGLPGAPAGTPMPSDFDGDGKVDPAVYYPETSVMTFYLSSCYYAPIYLTYGGTDYLPTWE